MSPWILSQSYNNSAIQLWSHSTHLESPYIDRVKWSKKQVDETRPNETRSEPFRHPYRHFQFSLSFGSLLHITQVENWEVKIREFLIIHFNKGSSWTFRFCSKSFSVPVSRRVQEPFFSISFITSDVSYGFPLRRSQFGFSVFSTRRV